MNTVETPVSSVVVKNPKGGRSNFEIENLIIEYI